MNKLALITLATLAAAWFTPNLSAQMVTIGFSEGESPLQNLDFSPYSESGFLFSQLSGSGSIVDEFSEELGVSDTVQITRIDGGLFDLLSLDVVFRNSLDELGTFNLLTSKGGTQNLATVTSYNFSSSDFQGLSWVNLIDVKGGFSSDNNTVDNITLSAVPEPSAAILLIGSGTLAFAFFRRRFRKE